MNQDELDFLKQYEIEVVDVIGQGGFGSVYYVYSTRYKTYFALKRIPENNFKQAEIDCLLTTDDPRIVRLYKYYKYQSNFYLLMEYCPNDLERLLSDRQKFSNPALTQRVIYDVIKAVKSCHDLNIAHCDIKPSNFLIDSYNRIKICDFGMSTICTKSKPNNAFKGTLNFMAPELFGVANYNPLRSDIWSLGVTLYYIATGQYPFNGMDQHAMKDKITKGIYSKDLIHDSLLRDLISGCIETDLEYRSKVDDLINHPYFQKTFSDRGERMLLKSKEVIVRPFASQSQKINKIRSSPIFLGISASRVHLIPVAQKE